MLARILLQKCEFSFIYLINNNLIFSFKHVFDTFVILFLLNLLSTLGECLNLIFYIARIFSQV